MTYYNAIIYWSYGSKTRYNNINNAVAFLNYMRDSNQLSSIEKIFWYKKQFRKDKDGLYCGLWTPKRGFNFHH